MPAQPPARNLAPILPGLLSLAAIAVLSGCADGGANYPSLASRPAERLMDAAPVAAASPAPAIVAAAPSAELSGQLETLVNQARSAKRDFDDQQAAAERLIAVAGAAPAGSEAWARATQALSGVESARSQTAQPLADLDRLDVEDKLHGAQLGPDKDTPRPDTAAVAQARETISAWVAQEDTVLAKLDGRLAR